MVHGNRVRGLAVTNDGKRILSGGEDKRIRVWDIDSQQPIEELGSHTSADICCLSLSPDGRLAASGESGGNLVIREMKVGGETRHSIHAGSEVYRLCFSPNGEKLACGVHMGEGEVDVIKVYEVGSGELVLGPTNDHKKVVRCVLWSLYGSQLFSASEDRTIRCWDSETGELIGKPWAGHMGNVFSLSLFPDGKKLASASWDKTIRLWDTVV
ncbi:WD40 repeat-like protein [Paxillus ammoniavirescens]|nr:WD40 repeat-like protein [Paxillus ammoniavirescens]